jgi:hypothetical protein
MSEYLVIFWYEVSLPFRFFGIKKMVVLAYDREVSVVEGVFVFKISVIGGWFRTTSENLNADV